MADPRYRALLIGNSTFPADANNLQTLEGPVNDVSLLRGALTDRDSGLFGADSVRILPERTSGEILVELEQFFGAAKREDVLLLYYSGHGLLNERGQLFLCARDTRTDLLKSTSVSSTAVNMMFDESAARTTIIVLDCCHSGAFKGGSFPDALKGSGRFLLTSCRSGQLANDADRRNGTSLFTQHLVEGITGGASDGDADGFVEVGELFDYVSEQLRAEGRQIPQRSFSGDGDVAIARRAEAAAVATKGARADAPPAPPPPVDAVHTELDFGRLRVGLPSPRLRVRLAGDMAVTSVDPWITVEEETDGVAVTVDTWDAGRLSGEVLLRGTGREARITVRAIVERPPEVVPGPPPPAPEPPPRPEPRPQPRPGRVGRRAVVAAALLVVVAAAAVIVASQGGDDDGAGPGPTTASTVASKSVALPGNVLWIDTGIDVRSGQVLDVTATGTVNTAVEIPNRSSQPNGIAGEENSENNVAAGIRHGAVIGRIGTNGPPFLVGSSLSRPAPATGRLYLGINDKGVANNSGQYATQVTVSG